MSQRDTNSPEGAIMTDAKKQRGRKSPYRPEYHPEEARKYALLGLTEKQIYENFGISHQTMADWKNRHPEFLEALRSGKDVADAQVVNALFQRALGYSHKAVKIMQYEGVPIKVEYVEHYPPDTAAAFIWLKNRRGWRDRIEANGDDTPPPESVKVTVEDASVPDADA